MIHFRRLTIAMLLIVVALLSTGCFATDATRGLEPEEVLQRSARAAQEIQNARIAGWLTADETELRYEGVAVFQGDQEGYKLLTFTMSDSEGQDAGIDIYLAPDELYVRWPDSGWVSSNLDPELAEGWSSIVEQTRMSDPAYAMQRIEQVAEEVAAVSEEEENGRKYEVIRVKANLEQALEVFAGVLPPELPLSAYADFHHTVWVDQENLYPYRYSIHLQILTSTDDLLPIHMEYEFKDINNEKLVLPEELKSIIK